MNSPWHPGEIEMQRSAGAEERMRDVGPRVLRDHLIEQHQQFYPQLPFIVLGAVAPDGDVWASVRTAAPGFLHSPDPLHLDVALDRDVDDPADAGLEDGAAIALLGIELHTRRRNRLNGRVRRAASKRGFSVKVVQAFGNCPQYIQLRDFRIETPGVPRPAIEHSQVLSGRALEIVRQADTFFVASYVTDEEGAHQIDVSHRGGRSGFVRVGADGALTIPDFSGNRFFNTLGNLLANPRAGLVFVDFENGDVLQLTGDAQVCLDDPQTGAFQGAERLWSVKPRKIVLRRAALGLRWKFRDAGWSPNVLKTGDWAQAVGAR